MKVKVDFDITKIEFTPYCDDYDFTLGTVIDDEGDECYLGLDIPCKNDPEWRFWLLFEDDNVGWDLTDGEMNYIKESAIKYCLAKEYEYNGKYFE